MEQNENYISSRYDVYILFNKRKSIKISQVISEIPPMNRDGHSDRQAINGGGGGTFVGLRLATPRAHTTL